MRHGRLHKPWFRLAEVGATFPLCLPDVAWVPTDGWSHTRHPPAFLLWGTKQEFPRTEQITCTFVNRVACREAAVLACVRGVIGVIVWGQEVLLMQGVQTLEENNHGAIYCCICVSTVKFYMKVVCFSECKKMDLANHGLILLQQLNAQREFGFLCDCTVAIGDVYFKAHKSVLASFSNYFKMLFVHQTR